MKTATIQIAQSLVDKATAAAKATQRTPSQQIEHWAQIGQMMEDNPDLPYAFVQQAIMAHDEKQAGESTAYTFE
ncbi:TA system antitoxin ParD family protein [Celerinatantimonas sp. YJH-8]|uniref:TA system antitoxin ParD family protein n=1 Tax=Celerinatantimonas sp. YJH-8 TaxID=3228714 RepID=UPI0038CBB528